MGSQDERTDGAGRRALLGAAVLGAGGAVLGLDPRTVADLITPKGLREIAGYAQGIGPTLDLVITESADGGLGSRTTLVADAHRVGLVLHPYTMRNENPFPPKEFRRGGDADGYGGAFGAFRTYFATGIDGVFTDNAGTGLPAREDFVNG